MCSPSYSLFSFFFNDTATTEIYTLSLHDALPISGNPAPPRPRSPESSMIFVSSSRVRLDRKSTRLNSSHVEISYAVFCLKKKIGAQIGDHFGRRHGADLDVGVRIETMLVDVVAHK